MRWIVTESYHPAIGWMSEVRDTMSSRRIIVAGRDHRARAERRAAELNAEAAA